jgi:hypothetical protein
MCVVGFGRPDDTEIQTRSLSDPESMESHKKLEFLCRSQFAKLVMTHKRNKV